MKQCNHWQSWWSRYSKLNKELDHCQCDEVSDILQNISKIPSVHEIVLSNVLNFPVQTPYITSRTPNDHRSNDNVPEIEFVCRNCAELCRCNFVLRSALRTKPTEEEFCNDIMPKLVAHHLVRFCRSGSRLVRILHLVEQ